VDYFSFEDVMKELELGEEELKRMVSEGELRAFRDENKMKFKKEDVESLKKGRITEPTIILPSTPPPRPRTRRSWTWTSARRPPPSPTRPPSSPRSAARAGARRRTSSFRPKRSAPTRKRRSSRKIPTPACPPSP